MAWDDEDLVQGPIPLWHQIAERLIAAIDKGAFVPGDALPSETLLTNRFGVSRTTARSALDHLEGRGLVERLSGRGSIVQAQPVEQPLNLLSSFSEDMRARGLKPGYGSVVVSAQPAAADVAIALGLESGTPVTVVDRLMFADNIPMATSLSYLSPLVVDPVGRLQEVELQLQTGSLYAWLEATAGARVAGGTEVISAGVANQASARRLGVEQGAPLMVARRVARDTDGRVVEYACREYRADRYRYRVELVRP